MFGFMLKKAFFDYWDNFFHFSILNLLFVVSLLIPFGLPAWLINVSQILSVITFAVGLLWLGIFTSASALYINEITQGRPPAPKQFIQYLKQGWRSGFLFALMWVAIALAAWFIVPFYSNMLGVEGSGLLAMAALAFLFWTFLLFALSMQFFFPIRAQLSKEFLKIIKKSFIIFFDNTFFAIGLFLVSAVVLVLSVFTAFLFIGPAGVVLLGQAGMKLRLYKYDYLEENPSATRKKIPWNMLIHEDKQKVGKRSLKGMIFPWKD